MSRIVIFVGSSLPKATVEEILPDALVLPPAEQGDVGFACHQVGASVIGLIDGVHSQRLPVWHKEILGILPRCRLFGAASMGALRSVECAPWGTEPVGEIAEWYASGYIDGDDEVCLAHGDESTNWKAFSVPMVNVRATLKAVPSIMLSARRKEEIIEGAKGIWYPERTWRSIQDACELRDFDLAEYEVDLKQADALQLCYTIKDLPPRKKPEREVRNVNEGYGAVFRVNDAKIFHHGRIHRFHEIAPDSAFTQRLALDRKLALAFCELAGIKERPEFKMDAAAPLLDMKHEEMEELLREESMLMRARQWLSSSKANFGDVPAVNDWMRANGLYEARKESL